MDRSMTCWQCKHLADTKGIDSLQRGCVDLPMVGAVSSVGETAIDLSTASGTTAWLRTAPR